MKSAHVVAAVAALTCSSVVAADYMVGTGEARSLSGVQTYDAIVCDGSLTIADDSVVTCSKLVIGSESGKSGRVEIGNNVSLTVTGNGGNDFVIGYDSASAHLSVGTNSVINCGQVLCLRRFTSSGASSISADSSLIDPTSEVSIHLKDNAKIVGSGTDPVMYFSGGSKLTSSVPAKFVGNIVRLDNGARLNFCCFSIGGRPHTRVLFNGGQLRQGVWNNSRGSALSTSIQWSDKVTDAKMYMTGTNGNNVVIYKDQWSTYLFSSLSGGGHFVFDGDGDVMFKSGRANAWKNGALWCSFVRTTDFIEDLVDFGGKAVRFQGDVTLKMTDTTMANASSTSRGRLQSFFSKFAELSTGPNVSIDLYGFNLSATCLNAEGPIFSSTDPGTPELVFGGAGTGNRIGNPGTNVVFRKVGTGSLVVSNALDVAELNVTTGSVSFASTEADSSIATFGRLALGENVSLVQAAGREIAVRELSLDASSTASVSVFRPAADGRLDVLNADFGGFPVLLPFEVEGTRQKDNLKTWTLYIDGVMKGGVGAADPKIWISQGHLSLGAFGTMMIFR